MRGRFRLVQWLGVLFGVVVFVAAGHSVGATKAQKLAKKDKGEKAGAKAKPIAKAS